MDTPTVEKPENFSISAIATSRPVSGLEEDVRIGLSSPAKFLHPKYFYDERGSDLFDQICDTPEYYLTRTEFGLLQQHATDIIQRTSPENLLELGSGTSRKTRLLLDAWSKKDGQHTYWPFDVSGEMLQTVAKDLAGEFPGLHIHALIGDYTAGLQRLPDMIGTTLALFVGSTLGNFKPEDASRFLNEIVACLFPGDFFLLGVDLDKDPDPLTEAYNDAQGITEAFNKNILQVINRELDADFDLNKFQHRAFYNREQRRVEMYLDAKERQVVTIRGLDLSVAFEAGESIWTEICRKFTLDEVDGLFRDSGLTVVKRYVDVDWPYALILGRLTG